MGRLAFKRRLISVREIGELVRTTSSMADRFIDLISVAEIVKVFDVKMNSFSDDNKMILKVCN